MLHAPLTGSLILFALPIAFSSMLQQLFNAADTAVVGRFSNADALATVGTNGEIVALLVTLSAGLAVGANVLIARLIGEGKTAQISVPCPDAVRILLILSLEPICSFYEIPTGSLRGMGYSTLPALLTILGTCVLRIAWIFTVFVHFRTLESLFVVFPLSWGVTILLVCGSLFLLHPFRSTPVISH